MYATRAGILLLIIVASLQINAAEIAVDPRDDFIRKLINTSSGAKQVLRSDNARVKKLHRQAKELFSQANEQFRLGNNPEGSALLDKTAKVMFEAIRLATPDAVSDVKIKHDYNKRKESINALSDAFDRITTEKNELELRDKVNGQLGSILQGSESMEKSGQLVSAKLELDKAYVLLKQSIESLRSGQTLVRSLNFATPEDEYHYELDRNDTHKMLVKLLLSEKQSSDRTQKAVTKFTQESRTLRVQAEQAAQDQKFEEAISLLEQSTKQLVRAIRSAGVYIPG